MTDDPQPAEILLISGTMGAGKSTLLAEASDLLRQAGIAHAAIDLDALAVAVGPQDAGDGLMLRNLADVWANCGAAGLGRALIARAVESHDQLAEIAAVLSGARITVVRLTVSAETRTARVAAREIGLRRQEFVARAEALDATLACAAIEDFTLSNDGASITDVAGMLLRRAGWLG